MSVAEVAEKLELHSIKGKEWNIQGCCGLTGDGLFEGMEWMTKTVKKLRKARR